jgi:hypothetical protein
MVDLKKLDITDRILYIIGIIAIILSVIYFVLSNYFTIQTSCLFRKLFGLYCPLCGGTRAAILLKHGKILKSLFYNPLVLYTALLGGVYMSINTMAIFCKRVKVFEFRDIYGYIFLAVMLLNFIAKNSMILFKGIYVLG